MRLKNFNSRYSIISWLVLALLITSLFSVRSVRAVEVDGLKSSIELKASELQQIATEIEANQSKLKQAETQKKSLQSEIKQVDYTLKELSLGVRASGIQIEKLGLEIDELGGQIKSIEVNVRIRKEAIVALLRELWQKEREGLLLIILRNQSLAESFAENQSLIDLNNGLSIEVAELHRLNSELSQKLDNTAEKQANVTVEQRALKNREGLTQKKKQEREQLLSYTKSQEKIYEEAVAELEKKQEEIGKEIAALEEQLRLTFDPSLLPTKRPGVLVNPITKTVLSQGYGKTEFAERAYRTKFHNGLDFAAPLGTPVRAAASGRVIAVDNNDRGSARWQRYQYGQYVLIEHENNLTSLYAHLSGTTVRTGDIVEVGELIGYVGNTGYSFGAHLHFTIYWSASVRLKQIPPAAGLVPVGVTVNPADYL